MKDNLIIKHLLPIFLAALVVFSSLGLGTIPPEARAEEARASGEEPTASFPDTVQGTWLDMGDDSNYLYVDTTWYDNHQNESNFTIATAEQLAGLAKLVNKDGRDFSNKNITITGTIDLGAHYWVPINALKNVTIVGENCTLKGLYLSKEKTANQWSNQRHIGLIADMDGGSIQNVTIIDSLLDSERTCDFVGFLIGKGINGTQLLNCNVFNAEMYAGCDESTVKGDGLHIGSLSGCLEKGEVENSRVENVDVFFKTIEVKAETGNNYGRAQVNAGLVVGGYNENITFNNVSSQGKLLFENRTIKAHRLIVGGIAGSAGGGVLKGYGCHSDVDLTINNCYIRTSDNLAAGSAYIGGVFGKGSVTENCINEGDIQITNNNFGSASAGSNVAGTSGFDLGGMTGKVNGDGVIIKNCVNLGDLTVQGNTYTDVGAGDRYISVGGIVGRFEVSLKLSNCYSMGKIAGESADDPSDNKGGIAGSPIGNSTITALNNDVFYLNAHKAFGSKSGGNIQSISLAEIVQKSVNGGSTKVNRIPAGDDNTFIQKASQDVFEKMSGEQNLGENFSVVLPHASQFESSNDNAAVVTSEQDEAKIKTVNGGETLITGPVTIYQNRLVDGEFKGDVMPIEADLELELKVDNVKMVNTSPSSAIKNTTPYALSAELQAFGTNLSEYTYSWEFLEGDQSVEPTEPGRDVGGLTQTPSNISGSAEPVLVQWEKKASFVASDAGWYRLKAQPKSFSDPYTFYSSWKYLSVDDLMVISAEETVELSSNDDDKILLAKGNLKAEIHIHQAFRGAIEYQWYHDGVPVSNDTITKKIDGESDFEITETYQIGMENNENLRGKYELRIVRVVPDNQEEEYDTTKDIRGSTTTVKWYDARASGEYLQSGPRYEGLSAAMEQKGIELSEDFQAGSYNAYFVKEDTIDSTAALANAYRADITRESDNTYTAKAVFTMKDDNNAGPDAPYRLIIYPLGTERVAVGSDAGSSDINMQFIVAGNCLLDRYAITALDYNLYDSYSTTDLKQGSALNNSKPSVQGYNKTEGELAFTKISGSEAFSIDPKTGEIICSSDPKTLQKTQHTLMIKVQDVAYTTSDNTVIEVPGTSFITTLTFRITGEGEIIPLMKNLYIYDIGYILADEKPEDQTDLTPYVGIYNIKAQEGESSGYRIIVVTGKHTEGRRIILNTGIQSSGVPVTVESGAAQIEIPNGQSITLENKETGNEGRSIQSDGNLILTGNGQVTLADGVTGQGSLTIGASNGKGPTVNTETSDITTATTVIESGFVTAQKLNGSSVTIKGGNVKADEIKGSERTVIDGGSIIALVDSNVTNSSNDPVYPVTLKLSREPDKYQDGDVSVTAQKMTMAGIPEKEALSWSAQASGNNFNVDGKYGELYVYLPNYNEKGYTRFAAIAASNDSEETTLSRKINANHSNDLTTHLLSETYSLSIPKSVGETSVPLGHGVNAEIPIGMNASDHWLDDGRSIDLEISPADGYKTIWGKYQMVKDDAEQDAHKPEFWIQTPSGGALSKAGHFGTLTVPNEKIKGMLIVPADNKITEGTYKSQLDWKITPNDPVVGGD